jgi:hypothetical protein
MQANRFAKVLRGSTGFCKVRFYGVLAFYAVLRVCTGFWIVQKERERHDANAS